MGEILYLSRDFHQSWLCSIFVAELSLIVYCALQNMKTRERAYTMADKGNKESATPNRQSETRMSTHAVRRFWTGKVRACLKQMLFTTRIISNCVKCEVREVLIKLWDPISIQLMEFMNQI